MSKIKKRGTVLAPYFLHDDFDQYTMYIENDLGVDRFVLRSGDPLMMRVSIRIDMVEMVDQAFLQLAKEANFRKARLAKIHADIAAIEWEINP